MRGAWIFSGFMNDWCRRHLHTMFACSYERENKSSDCLFMSRNGARLFLSINKSWKHFILTLFYCFIQRAVIGKNESHLIINNTFSFVNEVKVVEKKFNLLLNDRDCSGQTHLNWRLISSQFPTSIAKTIFIRSFWCLLCAWKLLHSSWILVVQKVFFSQPQRKISAAQ